MKSKRYTDHIQHLCK